MRTLNYMPAAQRYSRRPWLSLIVMLAFNLVLLGIAVANSILLLFVFTAVVEVALLFKLFDVVARGARWAYILEGHTLRFRRPIDKDWATIQVNDLAEIFEVLHNDDRTLEFVFNNGRRIFVDTATFGSVPSFIAALQQSRPEIRLLERESHRCPYCDMVLVASVWPPKPPARCPDCGAAVARTLPRIPTGGAELPRALAWL